MLSIKLMGQLGNQMWQYAVVRTIAERNGYHYHIPKDFLGTWLHCDLGEPEDTTSTTLRLLENKFAPQLLTVPDSTRLHGYFQNFVYLQANWSNVQTFFEIPKTSMGGKLNDPSVCVIGFRGTDYKSVPDNYLPEEYWLEAQRRMLEITRIKRFIVVTDDPKEARKFFPFYEIFHFNTQTDLEIIASAPNLIIANSTFFWWGAMLNQREPTIVAPEFWFGHNKGEWDPFGIQTPNMIYI